MTRELNISVSNNRFRKIMQTDNKQQLSDLSQVFGGMLHEPEENYARL